jgi:metal-responsive CopG/Arc/MetJ family transcriptional regulator
MKTLSLKLDEHIFQETEELLQKINKPRNRYINDALDFYNKLQKRKHLKAVLQMESALVKEESMNVLLAFELLSDDSKKV